jgi:glycosyltransferase involved in cell wall biosynthesis
MGSRGWINVIDKPIIQAIFYNNPDIYPPIINGLRLLAEAGFKIELFCRDDGHDWNVSYPSQVSVKRIKYNGKSTWQEYTLFVASVLRSGNSKASLFIGHDMHGLLPARLLATLHRRPLIYHCHDFADKSRTLPLGSYIVRAFEQRLARTSDLIIVPDQERGAAMISELNLKNQPLTVANAPLRKHITSITTLNRALSERGYHLKRILFRQGRIGVGHAIEATLRSMPYWNSKDWGFVLMGPSEPEYLEKLNAQALSLGIDRQFVILPPVSYDKVVQYTVAADVGHALYEPVHINNIHITTASNKIMEYLASGLPLLVSDTPAMRRFIARYQCGLLAEENVPESIAAAINKLLSDPSHSERMGRAARIAFESVFSYEHQFKPVLEYFQHLSSVASKDSHI